MKRVPSNVYTIPVEYCEWMDELYIKFPEELMTELDWEEGDTLKWEMVDTKTVVIKKKENN